MVIAIILILFAVALFLIFHDDHDRSYTRNEPKSGRENGRKSIYQKSAAPRRNAPVSRKPDVPTGPTPPPAPAMGPRTIVPEEKQYRPRNQVERFQPASRAVDFRFLDEAYFDHSLADRIMSSFIAGFNEYVQPGDLAGVVGFVHEDRSKGSLEVCTPEGRLLGHLPARDRVPFHSINPQGLPCPFAGHVGLSTTGTYYADIRIAVPCSREFVEQTLREFMSEP